MFGVAEQPQPLRQDRVSRGLAGVCGDGPVLPGAGDAEPRADLRIRPAVEGGAVAGVEDRGDPLGDRPRQDR
jgi:hypothetical protein